ncbi:MAG TPA: thermonuclease family protein [Patescibacteria group bacterium]|nr:thermonuclease family protein [Patescibacteria group bacterium]
MFKVLRKALILVVVLMLGAAVYHYVGNAEYRREIAQKSEEIREKINDEKKFAWTGTAVVLEPLKGDRAKVDTEANQKVIVRLAGIDAPELPLDHFHKGQPFAEQSRDHLAELIKGKAVQMAIVGTDADKRPLVLLTLDGLLVNALMVEAGLAEVASETAAGIPAKQRHAIENAELKARKEHLGIWTLTDYVRPIEFRIRQKMQAPTRNGTD